MNMLATSLLLSLGLSVAGQPNSRFYGIWVGVETYEIPAHGGPHARQGEPPVKKSVVIEIGDSGQTLALGKDSYRGALRFLPSGERTPYSSKYAAAPRFGLMVN
jgi:hypothetical protein